MKLKKTTIRESPINLMVIIYISQVKQTYLTTKRFKYHVMLPSVAWKYHISIAVCPMKNHLRRFTNLKGMLIKLILIKNTACSTNHLLVFHAKKDHIQPQAQREKLIITTVLSAASLSNKNLTF